MTSPFSLSALTTTLDDRLLFVALVVLFSAALYASVRGYKRLGMSLRWAVVAVLNIAASASLLLLLVNLQSPQPPAAHVTLVTDWPETDAAIAALQKQAEVGPIYALASSAPPLEDTTTKDTLADDTPTRRLAALQRATTPVADAASFLRLAPLSEHTTLFGYGLEASAWQSLPQPAGQRLLAAHWQAPVHYGLANVSWPRSLTLGEALTFSAVWAWPEAGESDVFRAELQGPGGSLLDSQLLRAGQYIRLSATPKALGPARFTLAVYDRQNTQLISETVAVSVTEAAPVRILLVQSAPSFEARHMLEWAARFGADLSVRTRISKDRFITQSSGSTGSAGSVSGLARAASGLDSADPFASDSLEASDFLLIDGRMLTLMDPAAKARLASAVSDGLGLMVLADAAYIDAQDTLGFAPLAPLKLVPSQSQVTSAVPLWPGKQANADARTPTASTGLPEDISATAQTSLPHLAYEFAPTQTTEDEANSRASQTPSLSVITSNRGLSLSRMVAFGKGRVLLSVLRDRHVWATSGDAATYARYWAHVMRAVARTSTAPRLLPASPSLFTSVGGLAPICALTGGNGLSAQLMDLNGNPNLYTSTLPLRTGGTASERACAFYSPAAPGWLAATLEQPNNGASSTAGTESSEAAAGLEGAERSGESDGALPALKSSTGHTTAYYYVYSNTDWQSAKAALRNTDTRLARQAYAQTDRPAQPVVQDFHTTTQPWLSAWLLWLTFTLSASLLWIERKLAS